MIDIEQLSLLGIGTSRVGSLGSRLSPDYFSAMLDLATENKVNLIDTADTYGSGDAERLLGYCMRDSRSAFFVITKAGIPYMDTPGWLSPLNQIGKKIKAKAGFKKNFTANYLINNLNKSNRRLGVNCVDAFLLHEPEYHQLTDDSWAGLEKIRQLGLANYTGVYTNDYRVVETGIQFGQLQVVQTSTAWNNPATDILIDLCRKNHIPVIVNNVLQSHKELNSRFAKQVKAIHQLNGLSGISLVQFLIAAVIVQKQVNSVLIGTTDKVHLEHNFEALRYAPALSGQLSILTQLLS